MRDVHHRIPSQRQYYKAPESRYSALSRRCIGMKGKGRSTKMWDDRVRAFYAPPLVKSIKGISTKNYEWSKSRTSTSPMSCNPLPALSSIDYSWCIRQIQLHQSRARPHETQIRARLLHLSLNLPNHAASKGRLVGNWIPTASRGKTGMGLAPGFQFLPEQRVWEMSLFIFYSAQIRIEA